MCQYEKIIREDFTLKDVKIQSQSFLFGDKPILYVEKMLVPYTLFIITALAKVDSTYLG